MRVFSKKILEFNKKCKKICFQILSTECGFDHGRTRVYFNGMSYDLKVHSYRDQSNQKLKILAYYNPNTFRIMVNYDFTHQLSEKNLMNLLRHEIAHFITHLEYGPSVNVHGVEFREICKRYNWGKEVFLSEEKEIEIVQQESSVQKKYEKIISLSQSDNINEAGVALKMAQKLLLTHPELSGTYDSDEEVYYTTELARYKRQTEKYNSIYYIMNEMGFATIFCNGDEYKYIESYGPKELVMSSKEIFEFLNHSLESSWKTLKKTLIGPKGVIQKNSFFRGFQQGVITQLREERKHFTTEQENSLIKLEHAIESAQKQIYGNLRTGGSRRYRNDQSLENLGFQSGKKFNTKFEKHKYIT